MEEQELKKKYDYRTYITIGALVLIVCVLVIAVIGIDFWKLLIIVSIIGGVYLINEYMKNKVPEKELDDIIEEIALSKKKDMGLNTIFTQIISKVVNSLNFLGITIFTSKILRGYSFIN